MAISVFYSNGDICLCDRSKVENLLQSRVTT